MQNEKYRKIKNKSIRRCEKGFSSHTHTSILIVGVLLLILSTPNFAIQFDHGDFTASFDSTLSLGAAWRVEETDSDLVGISNGGSAFTVNGDDGNLNYDEGVISSAVKGTHDLLLNYQNYGAFVRGYYFYDAENQDGDRERTELGDNTKDLVGRNARILDAYFRASFDPANTPIDIRVGNQVVNWGESTFIQNGISAINPVDVSKLRIPGAELREALLPVNLLWGSFGLTDSLTLETVYQIAWEKTEIDPTGSYFSTNDFAGEDGSTVWLGFGALAEGTPGAGIPRAPDHEADDEGQYGFALNWLATAVNTEFGLYHLNYHSRLPLISAHAVTSLAPSSANYFIEYPEDITLYGLSFNTGIGTTGIAMQGEVSHRKDVPLQVHSIELLFSALCSPASQLGACPGGSGAEISGYKRLDVTQAQMTATKAIGSILAANQWILLGEMGVTTVHDMPSKGELRFEGPGTPLPGNAAVAAASGVPQQTEGFADPTSWGYRLVTRLDYNSLFASINISPSLSYGHDVKGTSPSPGGNFIEGRKSLTAGLGANYQNTWSADLKYTIYYGAGDFNLIHDRDFASLAIKYAF